MKTGIERDLREVLDVESPPIPLLERTPVRTPDKFVSTSFFPFSVGEGGDTNKGSTFSSGFLLNNLCFLLELECED